MKNKIYRTISVTLNNSSQVDTSTKQNKKKNINITSTFDDRTLTFPPEGLLHGFSQPRPDGLYVNDL